MTQINLIVNSLPRDLLEFVFFLAVGFTAGSVGIIWIFKFFTTNNQDTLILFRYIKHLYPNN